MTQNKINFYLKKLEKIPWILRNEIAYGSLIGLN